MKIPIFPGFHTIKMVDFPASYVSLQEGRIFFQKWGNSNISKMTKAHDLTWNDEIHLLDALNVGGLGVSMIKTMGFSSPNCTIKLSDSLCFGGFFSVPSDLWCVCMNFLSLSVSLSLSPASEFLRLWNEQNRICGVIWSYRVPSPRTDVGWVPLPTLGERWWRWKAQVLLTWLHWWRQRKPGAMRYLCFGSSPLRRSQRSGDEMTDVRLKDWKRWYEARTQGEGGHENELNINKLKKHELTSVTIWLIERQKRLPVWKHA